MRTIKELTKEELMAMPLIALRRLDIETPAQQELVQEIVNVKLQTLPPQRPVFRRDIPDIQSPQEEAKWQTIINQREAKIRGTIVAEDFPTTPEPTQEPTQEPTPEVIPAAPETAPIPSSTPNEAGMAQASGEGEPVTISTGVTSKLVSKRKTKVN